MIMQDQIQEDINMQEIDETVIAQIADEYNTNDNKNISENEKENIIEGNIKEIKPLPNPDTDKDISNLIESYEPNEAVLKIEFANKVKEFNVSWNELKNISFWYTGSTEIPKLLGEVIKYDKVSKDIHYPNDVDDYISSNLFRIKSKMKELKILSPDNNGELNIFSNQKYYLNMHIEYVLTILTTSLFSILTILIANSTSQSLSIINSVKLISSILLLLVTMFCMLLLSLLTIEYIRNLCSIIRKNIFKRGINN